MATFRTKPVLVEALRWDGTLENAQEIQRAFGSDRIAISNFCVVAPAVVSMRCRHIPAPVFSSRPVYAGDWVVRDPAGVVSPCDPKEFVVAYEPACASDETAPIPSKEV